MNTQAGPIGTGRQLPAGATVLEPVEDPGADGSGVAAAVPRGADHGPRPADGGEAGDAWDFTERWMPRLEARLGESMEPAELLGPAYGEALGRALGVRGRGGRRWRPLLTLATADALGLDPERAMGVAAAVELTHTASLVLDDLPCMDDSATRRGESATHRSVGVEGAILTAVACLGRAVEELGESPADAAALAREWGDTVGLAGMSGGQAMDLLGAVTGPHRGARRRLHRRKSTALSAFALVAGARTAGAGPRAREALRAVGRDLGWSYQLADDARDRRQDAERGLPPGGRRPAEQSRRLLDRADARIVGCPGLSGEGRRRLRVLVRAVVEGGGPWPEAAA